MKILLIVVFLVILAGIILRSLRSRGVQDPLSPTIDEIPSIVAALERKSFDGAFVVFLFTLPGNNDELLPNLQYSMENRRVGLDWVLEAPQNIKDETAVADFIKLNGYTISKDMEDVHYLRVEGEGIDQLGVKILRDFYHLPPDTKLELIVDGV